MIIDIWWIWKKNRLDNYNQLIQVIALDALFSWFFSCELLIFMQKTKEDSW